MGMLILANLLTGTLATLFVIVAVLMILVVLIQKPKGGGLSGAFGAGGGGGTDQAMFGAKAGDVLTYITVGFFIAFISLGIGLVYATRAESLDVENLGVDQAETTQQIEENDAGAGDDDAPTPTTMPMPAPTNESPETTE